MKVLKRQKGGRSQCVRPIRRIVCVGATGGTLKTTATVSIAHVLAERGYRTLVYDLDPQGTCTLRSGYLRARDPLACAPVPVRYAVPSIDPGQALIAGSAMLLRGSRSLEGASAEEVGRLLELHSSFPADDQPDFTLVDTPPALGPITQAAMRQADIVVVPANPAQEGLDGIRDVLELHALLGLTCPVRVLLTRTLYLTKNLKTLVTDGLAKQAPFKSHPVLKLTAEIPFTGRGAEAGALKAPVTLTARDDDSAVAWRKVTSELATVLGLQIRQRRMQVRPAGGTP